MTGFKRVIRNFFGFSRKETNGFIILLLIMALSIFSEPIYRAWRTSRPQDLSKDKLALDSLVAQWKTEPKKATMPIREKSEGAMFSFDPNVASQSTLSTLGFSGSTASRIIHYREKGGKFKIKSDLLKIYGMDSSLYARLYTFIQLPALMASHQKKFIETERPVITKTKSKIKFDLNLADTAQLKKIYGIGPVLALRIVKYRLQLGGFIKPEQIAEVYGLDSSVVNKILKVSFLDQNFQPNLINVNTASEFDLDAHPYITKPMAKAIVTYRFQHGKFDKVEDIRNLHLFNEQVASKLMPYLKVED